jgi:hypothetical protein
MCSESIRSISLGWAILKSMILDGSSPQRGPIQPSFIWQEYEARSVAVAQVSPGPCEAQNANALKVNEQT